jgi:hypothetical protein
MNFILSLFKKSPLERPPYIPPEEARNLKPEKLPESVKTSSTFLRTLSNEFSQARMLKMAEQIKFDLTMTEPLEYTAERKSTYSILWFHRPTKQIPLTPKELRAVKEQIKIIEENWFHDCFAHYDMLESVVFKSGEDTITYSLQSREFRRDVSSVLPSQVPIMWYSMKKDEVVLAKNACEAHYDKTVRELIGDALMKEKLPSNKCREDLYSYYTFSREKMRNQIKERFIPNLRWDETHPYFMLWNDKRKIMECVTIY